MRILISWLLSEKTADLDLHGFQNRIYRTVNIQNFRALVACQKLKIFLLFSKYVYMKDFYMIAQNIIFGWK